MRSDFKVMVAVLILIGLVAVLFVIACQMETPARLKGSTSCSIRQSNQMEQAGPYRLPSAVHAAKGDTMAVDIANTEDDTVYFMVSGYNIEEKVPAHKAAYFEFTADKKGEFWFGNFMKKGEEGTLVVE